MIHRRLVIALHWATALLLLMMIKGGSAAPVLRWAFVIGALAWCLTALLRGPLAKPGPKLTGPARSLFTPAHVGIYLGLAATALLNGGALLGLVPDNIAWTALLVLLTLATFHAIFHLWRHTALNDGALRKITPRFLHKIL